MFADTACLHPSWISLSAKNTRGIHQGCPPALIPPDFPWRSPSCRNVSPAVVSCKPAWPACPPGCCGPRRPPANGCGSASSAWRGRASSTYGRRGRRRRARSSPCATWTRSAPARRREHFPKATFYHRLPQAARAEGPRRRRRRHARPHARGGHGGGPEGGAARLLREAADAHGPRGPRHRRAGGQAQARHADGHADPRRRQLSPRRRADPGGRHRAGEGGPRLVRQVLGRRRSARRRRRRCRRACTGTCGSGRPRNGPIIQTYIPFNWRRWWDFGGGTLADMACHYMDLPFWALEAAPPHEGHRRGPAAARRKPPPCALIVHYEFPARDDLPPVKLTWYDGGKRPAAASPKAAAQVGRRRRCSSATRACCWPTTAATSCCRRSTSKASRRRSRRSPNSIGHHKEWVEACKTGGPTTCNFDYSGALTEAVLLGNVAYRPGKPLDWDAKNLQATNDAGRGSVPAPRVSQGLDVVTIR